MTTENKQNKLDVELPESLKRQMKKFERRLCLMEAFVSIFGGIGGAMLTYSILFLSDRLWDTAIWLRTPITLLGGAVLGLFSYLWVHHWCLRRRDQSQLAKLVQHEYRQLGDRLQGVIELAGSESRPEYASPALCRAAVKQISAEISKYEFTKAVHTKKARTCFAVFLVLLTIVAAVVFFCPSAAWNTLVRWIKPLSSVERYTFVSIKDIPDTQVVPHGEDFMISCQIDDQSRWHPTNAFCRAEGQPIIQASIKNNIVTFNIPGQMKPSEFFIRIGDATRKIMINPVFRPELVRMTALITMPEYLERSPQSTKVTGGMLRLLHGSTVQLTGIVSRSIRAAELETHKGLPLATETNRFVTPSMSTKEVKTCVFSWTDHYGLACSQPYTLTSSVMKDEPPIVSCDGIKRSIAILADETVDIKIFSEDDFGLRKLWTEWKSVNHEKRKLPPIGETRVLGEGGPTKTSISGHYVLSPVVAGIPEGTKISFAAFANDYLPGRKPTMSQMYYIYVLSKAQHAKLVKEKLDMILAQLEDVIRREEDLLQKNEKIDKLSPEELASKNTDYELNESSTEERENAKFLKKLSEEGEKLLKEALRNKEIKAELLEEWAEMFEAMKQLSKNEAQQLLQNAAQKKEKRAENLKKAMAKEKELIEALKKMRKDLSLSIKNMTAYGIVDRLKAAAENEGKIGTTLQGLMAKIIGMNPADIEPDVLKKITEMAGLQRSTRMNVGYIKDDIAGFYNRTRIQSYGDVFDAMKETKIEKQLEDIEKLIRLNHANQAIGQAFSKQELLLKWAKYLKPDGEKDGEGGECNKQPTQDELELLIALLRARQQEGSLREQTRALEDNKERSADYPGTAVLLAKMQNEIKAGIVPHVDKITCPKVLQFVSAVLERMDEASYMLKKPQTDSETIGIETEIIEMLSACMSSACSSSSFAMSAALLQAMGLSGEGMGAGVGDSGGGSTKGGTTTKENDPVAGSTDGAPLGDRDVDMTSGMSAGDLPEEFREIMEAYYNALEEEE